MLDDRFWAKVAVKEPNECWEWNATRNNKGYGLFRPGGMAEKRLAHRLSWEARNRKLRPGECVLHKCDNPGCVNPGHLFVGSRRDNMQDCVKKGRHRYVPSGHPPPHRKGSDNPRAKMTEDEVRSYRERLKSGSVSLRGLARETGLSLKTLSSMRDGATWGHVK